MTGGDRHERSADDEPRSLTAVVDRTVPTLVVFLGIGLLLLDYSMFWVVFVVGFSGIFPAARSVAQWYDASDGRSTRTAPTRSDDDRALETLRNRYARGEIDEAEFEERVERLLETESVPDARTGTLDATVECSERGPAEPEERTK